MKTIEEAIRDKILYIGNDIPDGVAKDSRSKFVVLGTPQELIDETTKPIKFEKQEGKWSKEDLDKHVKLNTTAKAGSYSMVVVLAALYMKLYGHTLPDIGLSGFQGETAEKLAKIFPDPIK